MEFDAAVLHEVDTPMTVERVTMTGLKPGDVLVRVHASGLCHTDLEVIQGSLRYPLPIILGHEGAGVVEAVGEGVTLVARGDHVVCSWNPTCGHCFYCDRDQPILCEPFTKNQPQGHLLDGTSRLSLDGDKLHHFSVMSSHAQYCVVPESGAVRVPGAIPFDRACLIGCGVMTGVGGVINVAQAKPGDSLVVLGCGAVGLNAVQGARIAGCETIVAVDVAADKLALAETFGATHTLDATVEDVAAQVRALTAGRGADHVIEAAGITRTLQSAFDCARPGANVVLLGKTQVNAQVGLRWGSMMGERHMVRSSYGGARPRRDFPLLARLYLDDKLMLDELITTRLSLPEINDGFDAMREGRLIRAVIEMAH